MKSLPYVALLGAVALFCSCQNNNENQKDYLSDSTSIYGFTGDEVKLVKTASIDCRVNDVNTSAAAVSALAQNFGGAIFHRQIQNEVTNQRNLVLSPDSIEVITLFAPRAEITARIPVASVDSFLLQASTLSTETQSSLLHIEDKSLEYAERELRQDIINNKSQQLQPRPAKKQFAPPSNSLQDSTISNMVRNEQINADARFSIVRLNLSQHPVVKKERRANDDLSGYNLSFPQRLAHALQNGAHVVLTLIVWLANAWLLLLIAAVGYFAYRKLRLR